MPAFYPAWNICFCFVFSLSLTDFHQWKFYFPKFICICRRQIKQFRVLESSKSPSLKMLRISHVNLKQSSRTTHLLFWWINILVCNDCCEPREKINKVFGVLPVLQSAKLNIFVLWEDINPMMKPKLQMAEKRILRF